MHHRTSRIGRSIVAALLAVMVVASGAEAQRRTGSGRTGVNPDQGLVFGVHLLAAPGVSVQSQDVDFRTTFGPGAGIMVGYAFNRTFSAYASLDVARQGSGMSAVAGTFGLGHVEIGARAAIPIGDPQLRPYLTGSIGRRSVGARVIDDVAEDEYTLTISGAMLALGGGIERVISPTMSFDGGIELGFGNFGSFDIDGDRFTEPVTGSTTLRVRFGLLWRR